MSTVNAIVLYDQINNGASAHTPFHKHIHSSILSYVCVYIPQVQYSSRARTKAVVLKSVCIEKQRQNNNRGSSMQRWRGHTQVSYDQHCLY